jgi:hypothetical protein
MTQGSFTGLINGTVLTAKGSRLPMTRAARRSSPTGYAWGYGGSGPFALAHSVLAHLFGAATADRHAQAFKWAVIAPLPHGKPFTLPYATVRSWVETAERPATPATEATPLTTEESDLLTLIGQWSGMYLPFTDPRTALALALEAKGLVTIDRSDPADLLVSLATPRTPAPMPQLTVLTPMDETSITVMVHADADLAPETAAALGTLIHLAIDAIENDEVIEDDLSLEWQTVAPEPCETCEAIKRADEQVTRPLTHDEEGLLEFSEGLADMVDEGAVMFLTEPEAAFMDRICACDGLRVPLYIDAAVAMANRLEAGGLVTVDRSAPDHIVVSAVRPDEE